MSRPHTRPRRPAARRLAVAPLLAVLALLAGCGGGGDNPFGNPPSVDNPAGAGGRKLSFVYFQRCVNPVFVQPLRIVQGGQVSVNTCAASGCHDDGVGTGGAFRVVGSAAPVDPSAAAATVRASDMYRNFYSSQGESIPGQPAASRLVNKPLLRNVLHGGGLVFEREDDPLLRRLVFWISRPMPQGQDEFSAAANAMFAGGDPVNGECLVE